MWDWADSWVANAGWSCSLLMRIERPAMHITQLSALLTRVSPMKLNMPRCAAMWSQQPGAPTSTSAACRACRRAAIASAMACSSRCGQEWKEGKHTKGKQVDVQGECTKLPSRGADASSTHSTSVAFQVAAHGLTRRVSHAHLPLRPQLWVPKDGRCNRSAMDGRADVHGTCRLCGRAMRGAGIRVWQAAVAQSPPRPNFASQQVATSIPPSAAAWRCG